MFYIINERFNFSFFHGIIDKEEKDMLFKIEFLKFCTNPEYLNSGKADSYVKAITYLCNYLNIDVDNISSKDLQLIKQIEPDLSIKTSDFYSNFEKYLINRGKSSYLTKGFIKASLGYLYKFYNISSDYEV